VLVMSSEFLALDFHFPGFLNNGPASRRRFPALSNGEGVQRGIE
jgi:hypothetical protein